MVYKARWLIPPFFTAPFLTNSKILMHIAPLGLDITPSGNTITYKYIIYNWEILYRNTPFYTVD